MSETVPYLDAFLDMLAAERAASKNTLAAYKRDLTDAAAFLKRRKKSLSEADSAEIGAYLASLGTLAATSRARRLSALRQYYRFLISENVRAADPTAGLESPKQPKNLPGVPDIEAMVKLIEAAQGTTPEALRLCALLELAYGSGLRVSELVGLPLSAYDSGRAAMIVRGKGNKERLVPLSAACRRAVDAYLPERAYFMPGKKTTSTAKNPEKKVSPWLFPSRGKEGHLTRIRFWQILREAAVKAGLPAHKIHPHSLRHAFATHLLQGGADLRALQQMLGHADIATTQIYTHLAKGHLQDTVEKHHPLARKRAR
ncbi:MAG TPA: site-specific tyrosine recombinase XerD [Alphaproteobacteria bacterium]|nr:site-specific tyrosine recombinase XerD [Alphaproteobacteria bacterium]